MRVESHSYQETLRIAGDREVIDSALQAIEEVSREHGELSQRVHIERLATRQLEVIR